MDVWSCCLLHSHACMHRLALLSSHITLIHRCSGDSHLARVSSLRKGETLDPKWVIYCPSLRVPGTSQRSQSLALSRWFWTGYGCCAHELMGDGGVLLRDSWQWVPLWVLVTVNGCCDVMCLYSSVTEPSMCCPCSNKHPASHAQWLTQKEDRK